MLTLIKQIYIDGISDTQNGCISIARYIHNFINAKTKCPCEKCEKTVLITKYGNKYYNKKALQK